MNISEKLLKPYNPTETEDRIYATWLASGFFNPDNLPARHTEPFSMVLPPPNVTGTLHVGHSLMLVIQDIIIRYERMKGKKTLWLPGTDHAAIATQSKVEKQLEKEGIKKRDIGREEFLKKVEEFAQASHDTIVGQVKKMGASVDWSREAYTLDQQRSLAVRTAFKKMYDDGLIYRGYRIVNWDPKGQTTISDDEVEHTETKGTLYTFKYAKDFPIAIATTRPETKLGDTAVAVHPDDTRYQEYIGKEYDVTFAGAQLHIKIVADEVVDPAFGTGAVGVTPAHSVTDWEIAQRHNLPLVQVINEFGKMSVAIEGIEGKKVVDARQTIVEWIKTEGLLEKEEEVQINVAVAERTGGVVEPLPKLQWFVAVNKPFHHASGSSVTLKQLMLDAVQSKKITIIPDRFEKVYFNWIENLRDWCISRQIWYGHRIPVWYRGDETYVGTEVPSGDGWTQDEDTLDTWFSSGLWSFSTLGWPEETKDFKLYHPTDVLETGYDIIFFWVARMILMTTYLLNDVPFKTVYLHGLVRDGSGKKMSKSLGNILDPLDVIRDYGADALRMALIIGTGPGNDSRLSLDKVKAYKLFSNKLWNIARFILSNINDAALTNNTVSETDIALIAEWQTTLADITSDLEAFRFYLAGEKLYHYVWHRFADAIIEESKERLQNDQEKLSTQTMLYTIFTDILRALHPFMPYITEELWSLTPGTNNTLLMINEWPQHA
jgi:valyl-tRNA synthetase